MGREQELEIKASSFKFRALSAIAALLFFVLLFRLAFLQIYHGERLKDFSDSNRFKKQLVIAPRGLILDRNGKVLAGSKKTSQLIVHLNQPQNLDAALRQISHIINIPAESLKKTVDRARKRDGPFYPAALKEDLPLIEIHKLKQLYWERAEIEVREAEKRVYPLKENGSQALGFIGPVSKKEIQSYKRQKRLFHLGDIVGKSGLERAYNESLKGQNGFSMLEVDSQNRPAARRSLQPYGFLKIDPVKGKDLALTIDRDLQELALKAMRRKDALGPRTGAVIVMKTNGEILALLSEPGFDPNILSSRIDQALWEKWSAKGSKVFINKSLQEHYSPGSVFKPFVALAALKEGLIKKETLISSPAAFKAGRRIYRDHNPRGHGQINVVTALEKSANTFFYQIAHELGIEKIRRTARLFGFGQKTNIDLAGESPGLLPGPSWKEKTLSQKWQKGDTINISIGQGDLLATLLQTAVAYNAIATEGLMVKPFIIQKEPEGKIKKPVILDSLTDRIKRKHFITVKEGLKSAVEGRWGTARGSRLPSLSFSGKTGTAQVISLKAEELYKKCSNLPKKSRHHGWFVSFAPSEKPEIVVAVFTESSCSGSKGSAPVARDIIAGYFKAKGAKAR